MDPRKRQGNLCEFQSPFMYSYEYPSQSNFPYPKINKSLGKSKSEVHKRYISIHFYGNVIANARLVIVYITSTALLVQRHQRPTVRN